MKVTRLLLTASLLTLIGCGAGSSDSVGVSDSQSPSTQIPSTQIPSIQTPPAQAPDSQSIAVNTLGWSRPDQRENGDYLEADELGGYELRYREGSQGEYQRVLIEDPWQDEYSLSGLIDLSLAHRYEFQIASVDRSGLYSEFVALEPYFN